MIDSNKYDPKAVTKACFNLGWVSYILADDEKAFKAFDEAMAYVVNAFGKDSEILPKILNNRGVI